MRAVIITALVTLAVAFACGGVNRPNYTRFAKSEESDQAKQICVERITTYVRESESAVEVGIVVDGSDRMKRESAGSVGSETLSIIIEFCTALYQQEK